MALVLSTLQCVVVVPPPAAGLVSFACGGVAGALGAALVYPIDSVKTLLQTEEGGARFSDGPQVFRSIVAERGPLALYRGIVPQLCGVAPEKAIKIFVNDWVAASLTAACGGVLPAAGEALAGFTAGCCQVIVTSIDPASRILLLILVLICCGLLIAPAIESRACTRSARGRQGATANHQRGIGL